MTAKKTSKTKVIKKRKSITPVVLGPKDKNPVLLVMDGTPHPVVSQMQNIYYSHEIIKEARKAFDLQKLKIKKKEGENLFLAEGEKQIYALWHSIEALTTHNTMFVVLFLISIGEILNEIRSTLTSRDFVKWRREAFDHKHERYLQQAQQLAKMGDFAKQLASMGKKRLLSVDRLRKIENIDKHKQIFDQHPLPKEVKENLVPIKTLKKNPFPDSTEDLDGDLLKEHVDAVITYNRLMSAGIDFASFDQAFLLAKYNKDAIPIKMAKKIKEYLNIRKTTKAKEKLFDDFVMDKGKFPFNGQTNPKSGVSLNHIFGELVDYCSDNDINNKDWIESQKTILEEKLLLESHRNIKTLARKFGIRLSGNNQQR